MTANDAFVWTNIICVIDFVVVGSLICLLYELV